MANIRSFFPLLVLLLAASCDIGMDTGADSYLITDGDGDGYDAYEFDGGDCNDDNPAINQYATEVCNGIDDDCDGSVDEGCSYLVDADGDGYYNDGPDACLVDCNDENSAVHPHATEITNGIDDDCDNEIDEN